MLDVKAFRKKMSLTQGELSKKLDVNIRTVQKWESGETKMSGDAVLKIQEINNEFEGVKKEDLKNTVITKELTPEKLAIVIDAILYNEKELMQNTVFKNWVYTIQLESENKILKSMSEKKARLK